MLPCVVGLCFSASVILQDIVTMLPVEHVRRYNENDIHCMKLAVKSNIFSDSCTRLPKHRKRFGLCGSREHDSQRPDMHVMVITAGDHLCYLLTFVAARITLTVTECVRQYPPRTPPLILINFSTGLLVMLVL